MQNTIKTKICDFLISFNLYLSDKYAKEIYQSFHYST